MNIPTLLITRHSGDLKPWEQTHNRTVMLGDDDATMARSMVLMCQGVQSWLAAHEAKGQEWPDYVATPALGEILSNLITLLNFDIGRLDAGTMDKWLREVADIIGWDAEMDEMKEAG